MNTQLEFNSLNEECLNIGRFLGLDNSISTEVLFCAVSDPVYAYNLFVCRETAGFLTHLLNNPPLKCSSSIANNKEPPYHSTLEKARRLIHEWKNIAVKEDYHKRFETYRKVEEQKSPDVKPCNCTEIPIEDFREVYLDCNATTYIRAEINKILTNYQMNRYGFANPSSNTLQGSEAFRIISEAKDKIAGCLYVKPEEIVFTGSGSESNNFAIKGIAFQHLAKKGHLITSKLEHMSVLQTMEYLQTLGFSVTYLDVGSDGLVSSADVKAAIRHDTLLVSIMAVNNEIGIINPLKEIGHMLREHSIPFMVDAIQGFGKILLNPKEMGISLLTFSGHKIYAPKGIGGLFIAEGLSLVPQIHGGGQEYGLRSGTENVGYILAMGEAARLAHGEMVSESNRLLEMKNFFLDELYKIEPGLVVNGSMEQRVANNLNISFPGVDSGALVRSLNRFGICVSAGSACSSRRIKTSHVLKAIGADTENYAAIRFGFGLNTTKEDLFYVLHCIGKILKKLKKESDP